MIMIIIIILIYSELEAVRTPNNIGVVAASEGLVIDIVWLQAVGH